MILICKEYKEDNQSHEDVIDWLLYRNANFSFLSGKDYYQNGEPWCIQLDDLGQRTSRSLKNYKSIWFRGFLRHRNHLMSTFGNLETTNDNISELRWRIGQEILKTNSQIFDSFGDAYTLPNPKNIKIDKFDTLRIAKQFGIETPISIITNSREKLVTFISLHKRIITKPLYETVYFKEETKTAFFKTEILDLETVTSLPETFFPSFFQAYVEKDIELRIFYIEGEFYPMAIFSQLDPKTKTDFRNYNEEKPNRNVPYILPDDLQKKLDQLMNKLKLNTGSIDLIKTPDKKYVFLEVNPTGQFGFTSKPCNYYLEDIIAQTLIKNDQ